MFDVLIEYYHMGVENNRIIFYDIEKDEMLYWEALGLDEKGREVDIKEITEENYKKIIFNEYEGNAVKNVVKQAIKEMRKKKEGVESKERSGNILATENQQAKINDVIEVKTGVYLYKT